MPDHPADGVIDLDFWRHARELRDTWQGRLLARALSSDAGVIRPRSLLAAALLSVISHNYDDGIETLLRVVFKDYRGVGNPALTSAAKIDKSGRVCADGISRDGDKMTMVPLFADTRAMEGAFRRVADAAKLTDAERVEMFNAVRRWVVCDYRLDPTMDPNDPDAKRLKVN